MVSDIWTPNHDAYCLSHGLEGAAKLIWQWLVRHQDQQHEPDLGQFNAWVEEHRGKPYHRDTIKLAWQKLISASVIRSIKKFTWKIWRITLRPITLLIKPVRPKRKLSRNGDCDRDSSAETGSNANRSIYSSSKNPDRQQILKECTEAGLPFNEAENPRILEFPLENVQVAIAYFLYRFPDERSKSKLRSPQGWLINCLDRELWTESQNFYNHLCAYDILPWSLVEECWGSQ